MEQERILYEKGKNHRERVVVVAGVTVQASPVVPPGGGGGMEQERILSTGGQIQEITSHREGVVV